MKGLSVVRTNLLTQPCYTPYCGADLCTHGMPRTEFKRDQFQCSCGWRSSFEAEFIEKVKQIRAARGDGK